MNKIIVRLARTLALPRLATSARTPASCRTLAAILAAAVAASATLPANAATVKVSQQTETSLTFTFAGFGGLDHELYVAHGATDGGEDKHAWDSFEKVADIAGDQTTYEYTVPAALRDGRHLRFFLMQTLGINMAKEYVSITSTGAQSINTGVAAASNWSVDFRFRTAATLVNDTTFFGQAWGSKQYLFILQNDSGTKFRFYGASNYTVSTPQVNTDYRVFIDPHNYLTITGGGSETRKSISRAQSSSTFKIFSDTNGSHPGSYTFYRMKVIADRTPKFDFVPAANAAGAIGLYDQVNNVFYPNQTATPFQTGAELPQSRFGRVMDTTPTFRFPRSVAVSEATATAVTLAFGNPCSETHKLYVAYGATDCEDRKNAWANFEEVADIAGDATFYTYTLPAALKADGVYYRFFLAKTATPPYASELVSVTSTGAQLVKLDYIPGTDTTVDLRFGGVTYENQKVYFGQHWGGNAYLFNMQDDGSNPSFRFHGVGTATTTVRPAANTDYRCRITAADRFILDGGGASSVMPENRTAHPHIDLCVFAVHYGGYASKFRFDSMLVKDGAVAVRDLVPVQTAAGKGALFDRVTGRVFANVTGTDFTKGAAAPRQAWVVSTTPTYAGSASAAPTVATLLDSITLTEDTEWSSIADRLADVATVNLNGHELHVADYAAFLAKHTILAGTGNFRMTVPSGSTFTFGNGNKPVFTGKLIKDGAGTLVISGTMTTLTGVTVAEGIMKYGAQSVFGNNGMTVEVKDGAAFDVAGNGNGNAVRYKIAGIGPDGNGALRNTGGDVTNGSAQMYGLELTADAKVTGNSQGFIGPSYAATTLALNGHTLTLALNSGKSFWFCNTSGSTSGTVHVKNGIVYFYKTAVNIPNVDFVIDGASSIYRMPTDTPANATTVNSVTVMNGGVMEEGYQATKPKHLRIFDGGFVGLQNNVRWIYVSGTVVASNETTDVTIYPPIAANGTSAKLLKYGAGTFYIKNNHTDQQMNSGAEIFGGTVVMDSVTSPPKPEIAIASAAVPVTIHAGGTLDMRFCTNAAPFKVTKLVVEDGGTLLHTANNRLSIAGAATYTKPLPFGAFAGSLEIAATVTFDLAELYSGASAPAQGADVTLFSAGTLTRASAGNVVVTGCPYEHYVSFDADRVVLHTVSSSVAALDPIKIWSVGGSLVYGANNNCYRATLGSLLSQEGWNVQMTGWRTANASALCNATDAWKRHAGVTDLALKTSATRAGLLEGLETYCAAANEPDFTIFLCGDRDVADNVSAATVFIHYTNAVTRIKAALPMTTVIACTIPGGSAELNELITTWCAGEADVECVDAASAITSAQTVSECNALAAAIKAKLVTLATASGKNTPSTWVRPTVVLDATNNVPPAYLAGFTRVRSIEPTNTTSYAQSLYGIPYAYAPQMQETGIAKVGYYIELVRRDTGALQAMWIDMDAPGPNWADVAFPVTTAQKKQKTVTKLHVWSNFGGVRQVPADDDSVEGYIEFNCNNYKAADRTGDVITEPWSGQFGFNDTFETSGSYGCFQIMRKFSEEGAFPAAEILFAYSRWGNVENSGVGMGTLANYGNHGNSNKALDWTHLDKSGNADMGNISGGAYSFIRIEFWLKYDGTVADRASNADYAWASTTNSAFATAGNWAKDETPATTLANKSILLPEGASQTFTYIGWDPVSLTTTRFMVDGAAEFPDVGGLYLAMLDMGATGKITYDPVKFTFRLLAPPAFEPGAKIALASRYASATKGRFLLMTWDRGQLDMDTAALNAVFDTSSANGADVKVWVEELAVGGRLWLDLDYSTPKKRVNVLCVGDSITHGSDDNWGNWRTTLMKRLAAAGYEPVAKGHRNDQSHDICGATMPDEWIWHAGIGSQGLITYSSRGGTIDQIDATLDQAGDIDFILVKLGTNDINSNSATADTLMPVWTNLVWTTLNRKPHVKFIAGAVVDIAYDATKNGRVVAYNAAVSNAIASAMFPAKRAYFADLYTPCYRYSVPGDTSTYITGSFLSASNLHPDWPGEYKMAETYFDAIQRAIDEDPGFELNAAETVTETTGGIENNVPAAYLAGLTRARVLDVAADTGKNMSTLGYVPYSYENAAAPTVNLTRVGYYIELKRKDTALSDYHDLTRWMWVSMDAFGNRTIDDVGVPLTTISQCAVERLRVKTNMPGIESTSADATDVRGWVEFWPSTYSVGAGGGIQAPADVYQYDWNDTRENNMSGFGSMQVHRFTPGEKHPAQVMFAFNHWTADDTDWEIGLGNFAHTTLKTLDWTHTGAHSRTDGINLTMSAHAYEVAKIEIWTAAGAPPDAAFVLIDDVAAMGGGEARVTGDVRNFGEGATNATITLEWSTDPTFATVAGSTNIGVVAETGAVTATATGLTAGQTWYFRYTSVNSENVSTTSAVSDPLDYDEGVWRPQTTGDVWTSVAWQKNGTGEHVTFNPAWNALFDGNEATKVASVQVPELVSADQVTVDSSENYTLTGAGAISSRMLLKKGTGTLTLGAAVLAETPDIEIQGGTVKLGADATKGAAGRVSGTITVKNGGQFDLYHNDGTSGADRARALVTRDQKFVIEGAGPDGEGAIVSTYANDKWGSPIKYITLAGDATIGGVSRLDLRTSDTTLVGPTNVTLTVKTHPAGDYGLGPHGTIKVGKIDIAPVGKMFLESTGWTVDVPYGIDLYGALWFYGDSAATQWKSGTITACGSSPSIGNNSGNAHWGGPLVVPSGVALTMKGSATLSYDGVVTNNGTIATTGGTHDVYGNLVNGENSVVNAGASFRIYSPTVTGDLRVNTSGGQTWFSGRTDWGDNAVTVALSSAGSLVIGSNVDGYGMPSFAPGKFAVSVASGHSGTVYLHPSVSTSLDYLNVTGTIAYFCAQGPTTAVVDCRDRNMQFTATTLNIGTTNGRGEHTFFGPDTHVVAGTMYLDNHDDKRYNGMLNFKEGILDIGSGGILTARRQPMRPQFLMSGGTLRATANFAIKSPGMTASFGGPKKEGDVTIDLNGKTVTWATGLNGASDVTITGTGTFSSGRPGIQGIPLGKWTVNNTGNRVDLRNAAGFAGGLSLAAGANAMLDIAGTNTVDFLAWTWHDNAWDIMKPLFTSGAPMVVPHVATSLKYINQAPSQITDKKYGSGTGFNYMGEFYVRADQAGKWYFAQRNQTYFGIIVDGTQLSNLGPNKGGIYNIDLTEGWHRFMFSVYTGGDNPTIGPMTDSGELAKVNGIWFKVGGSSSGSWPSEYTPFDVTTVPIRTRQGVGARTSVRWRKHMSYGDSASVYADADESKYTTLDTVTNSLQVIHKTFSTGVNAPLGGASARFDGYFKVKPEQEGVWTFNAKFDDRIALSVDGRRLFAGNTGTASMTLRPGWHKFDIRTGDTTPSGNTTYGTGGGLTDSVGNTVALEFKVNGGAYYAFDERYLPIAYSAGDAQKYEVPGLGGEIELAAGSILTNDVRTGGWCPIYGTLKGSGTLAGPYRFTGENNCWKVEGATARNANLPAVNFAGATLDTFAGLKQIRVLFDAKPSRRAYYLTGAVDGLTVENMPHPALNVAVENDDDYEASFTLTVKDSRLALVNGKPKCMMLIVR